DPAPHSEPSTCTCPAGTTTHEQGSNSKVCFFRENRSKIRTKMGENWSRLGLELILIFCSRFLVIKLVRSPSWLTVPSSSRAEEIVARLPSDCPLLPPPRAPDPPGRRNTNSFLVYFGTQKRLQM
uniref:Uncharacterized protein n=1 Tax=Oryzias melastigma TaxID=30732 RepID=A0A3B3D7N7_ORYME